jgi:hypothetical protein
MSKKYNPRPETADLLKHAYDISQSVPYEVTTRWVFYQLVQLYGFPKSAYGKLKGILSKARHSFYEGWAPDTLTDDSREIVELEGGFDTIADWVVAMGDQVPNFPAVRHQDCILQIWFEAAAMRSQFEYYVGDLRIDLVPFGGDPSIRHKWNVARRLQNFHKKYDKPIVILYFGDYDPKGLQIPESALKHIWHWTGELKGVSDTLKKLNDNMWSTADGKFRYIRVGINKSHVGSMDIPENPEKPGTYQWEALKDEMAGKFILDAIKPFWSKAKVDETELHEQRHARPWKRYVREHRRAILKSIEESVKAQEAEE